METVLIILIIIVFVVIMIKQLNKITEDTPVILSNNEVELVVNLNIKSQTDLQKAEKQLDELHDYEWKTSGESYESVRDTIDKLEEAIDNYKYEARQEKYIRERESFREYPLEEVAVVLHYRKENGEISNRTVDVTSYKKTDFADSSYIYGYCHLRNEYRTFRVDRIKSLADGKTGEIIKDIKSYFIKKYESSIYYKMDCLFEKYKEIFRVLFYIAKADGSYLKAEKIVIRDAVRKLTNDSSLTDENIDDMMSMLDVPTFNAFKVDVKIINKKKLSIDIFKIALDIVNTQNKVHTKEREALEYMAENLDNVSKDDIVYKADLVEQLKKQKALEKLEKEIKYKDRISEPKKECIGCNSKNTLKKGTRRLKNHSMQRYQCNDCGKVFSEKIEENNN
ncbi:hypothetical protein AAX29_00573 [Aliarcobacter thereius]|uniref:WYL domain-containing protein n=1 Tax=Aliarcobacter thereius TaxID=544718 RepID=A0A1C0B7M4_9BACT|nr:WYL domain-containing protein [Aliarcobacter thereius]OCL99532.1 hypothetical protein AAX29_00573 [Aliarcobacter thereius]